MLLIGAILAPGTRTVASLLRICGLMRERHFVNYHRVLNRAAWSPLLASRLLLRLLIETFAPNGPVVLGLDDTIERRRGKRIAAKGIYRDPVRSSHGHFVKASGLRWLSVMLLVPIPWAERIWALPFLTALAPSERHNLEHGRRRKKLTEWGRQVVLQARRWLPERDLVLVADSSFAALDFLAALVGHGVVCITRLRLDAAFYDPARPVCPEQSRTSSDHGRAAAELVPGAHRCGHDLAARLGAGLVWRGRARCLPLLRHRGLAPCWTAHRADPLGVAA
ncbi:MAG TPA: transposase [Gemmatimonadales bacterium]|nr:transposase [Gemmatimonadales bacterium]